MIAAGNTVLHVKGLGRPKLNALVKKAKRLGMTPEEYVRQLVAEDLAITQDAQSKTFAQIMSSSTSTTHHNVNEEDLDQLVDKAKAEHHARSSRRKGPKP